VRRGTFRAFLLAYTASEHADGLCQVVLPLLALRHGDGVLVGLVTTAARAPWLVLALPAGVLADRADRRSLLLTAATVRAAVATVLGLLVLGDRLSPIVLGVLAFLLGCCEVVHDTAAHALTPRLVDAGDLPVANARLQSVEYTANHLGGRALGGLFATVNAAVPMLFAGVVWGLGTVVTAKKIPANTGRAAPEPTVPGTLRTAVSLITGDPALRNFLVALAAMNTALAAFAVVLPTVVVGGGHGAGVYGLLLAVGGLAGLATSLLAPALLRRLGYRRAVLLSCLAVGCGAGAPAVTADPVVLGAGVAATGLGVVVNVVTLTTRQLTVPDALLGRVTSVFRLVTWGALPAGSLLAGLALTAVSPAELSRVAGAVILLATIPMGKATKEIDELPAP